MKKPNAFEFDEKKSQGSMPRLYEHVDRVHLWIMAQRKQHTQDKITIDKLLQVIREQREVIEDCLTTIAEECPAVKMVQAEKTLESTDKILKEMGLVI